ncbi:MAG: CBS domain-containing protein [Candidatus Omnitrophica bacterium]|nr:CBS domain-containing protein [Candidatus Omnitrophota bacterium]
MPKENPPFNSLAHYLRHTKVKDIMKAPATTMREEDSLSVALLKFIGHRVSHVAVLDETNRLIGVISKKYLYRAHAPRRLQLGQMVYAPDMIVDGDAYFSKGDLDGYFLSQVIKRDPLALRENDTLADAVDTMWRKNLAYLPIVDRNRYVVGALTDQDVIAYFAQIAAGAS